MSVPSEAPPPEPTLFSYNCYEVMLGLVKLLTCLLLAIMMPLALSSGVPFIAML